MKAIINKLKHILENEKIIHFIKNNTVIGIILLASAAVALCLYQFLVGSWKVNIFDFNNNINLMSLAASLIFSFIFQQLLMSIYRKEIKLVKIYSYILVFISISVLISSIVFSLIIFKKYSFSYSKFYIAGWFSSDFRLLYYKNLLIAFLIGLLMTGTLALVLLTPKKKTKITGNYGTAEWATSTDLKNLNAYDSQNGLFIGQDVKGKSLYLPLSNKLTIAPPGGRKSTSSSMPALLSHDGPAFVFDIKGELWAVTARYRAEVLGRKVIVIDPFGLSRSDDFKKGKNEELIKEYHINPFDWIPEDKKKRDRMLTAFAASLVINEGGHITHFDDNAKILIRGYIDYMMTLDKKFRILPTLFNLMSENVEEAMVTFERMMRAGGRAEAASNQISRVGSDERGSILSTSYRQIDWMGDSNIQDTLSESNFDLRDFLKGNMDIFVILPEDQVKEHCRLFRMIMCLLLGLLVQANPSELPKKKILFLLEEVAQIGASPDIEQCIEILRARGVIVWTVFQTLSQIEMFNKPDLFKGVPLKQIFTNDDVDTMKWVQSLGGEKSILAKSISTNKGDSQQSSISRTSSRGEGESIHETGVPLIQINEIREMKNDEQLIFIHEHRPIKCKKVRYFETTEFSGKYDPNPLIPIELQIFH